MSQVIPNGRFQLPHATEGPAPNPPIREQAKEALYLIQPTRASRREVQMIPRSTGKPALNFGHLVGPVVIHHQMNIEVLRDGLVDTLQEAQKLLMSLTVVQRSDHFAGGDVQGGKQR